VKALCADVDKVEARSWWGPLQRANSTGAGAAPCAPLFSASLHGVDGENKHEIAPENCSGCAGGSEGSRRDCLGDKGKLRINSQSVSLGGSLREVPCEAVGSHLLCVEAWKIFCEDCF